MFLKHEIPDWQRDGAGWPNAGASRFLRAGALEWHVQVMGEGPAVLLLHGTGAASHSWRDLAPLLAREMTVIAPDLPGHGFTSRPSPGSRGLPGVARAVHALVAGLGHAPALIVGHSAGAAVALRLALDGDMSPAGIVSLNGALRPFPGMAGILFPTIARALSLNPLTPRLFANTSDTASVTALLAGTGSSVDAGMAALYTRLIRKPSHVAGALGMMAAWDLEPLVEDLGGLSLPLHLIAGSEDRAVPPEDAVEAAARLPGASAEVVPGLGHLAHEEDPDAIVARILAQARNWGVLPA